MTNHMYLPVIVLFIAGAGFAIGPLALAWLWARTFSPQKSGPTKNRIYECGLESSGDAWIKFKPGYYIYAILFLIFDVEGVFLLPFAVAFGGFTVAEAVSILVFLILLAEGLVWACQKKVLAWS